MALAYTVTVLADHKGVTAPKADKIDDNEAKKETTNKKD